jgi:hypothetical protein
MRSPSVKNLVNVFHITKEEAEHFKNLCSQNSIRQAMLYANRILKGYGCNCLYPEFSNFWYVNMGETYETTICFTGRSFIIGSWGDWVENHRPVPNDGSNPY